MDMKKLCLMIFELMFALLAFANEFPRGYASRSLPVAANGHQRLRIYLLDPGIVLQEILVHSK